MAHPAMLVKNGGDIVVKRDFARRGRISLSQSSRTEERESKNEHNGSIDHGQDFVCAAILELRVLEHKGRRRLRSLGAALQARPPYRRVE